MTKTKDIMKELDCGYINSWEIKSKEDIHPSHRIQVMDKDEFERATKRIKAETLKEVEKIVNDWYDIGIDLPNSNLQLMATNGGYIKKFDLLKKLKELGGTK